MDRAQLLQHFNTLAETPNAVEKLRKLVLDFAIRGRLVPQYSKDDPAIQLLERAKAVSAKNQKKSDDRSNGEIEVPPFSVPKNWCWTCLEELGDTAPKNELNDKIEVGFSPMRLINAKFGEPISFERRPWSEVRKGFTHFADGDVVVAKITPCFQNGKSGVIRGAPNGFGAGTTELHVLRPVANCVLPDYVLVFLKSPHFLVNGEAHMTGTAGQKRVSWSYFARTPFPLPPLAEQRRIVTKVEELLALCDELEARQTVAREHRIRLVRSALDHLTSTKDEVHFKKHSSFCIQHSELLFDSVPALRQAILCMAVQGHLVPAVEEDGTGAEVLNEIGAEPLMLKNAPVIPNHWRWAKLGDLVTRMDSGWSPACPANSAPDGAWGVLRTTAVQTLRYLQEENKALPKNLKPRPACEVIKGDILITRAGPKNRVGISCVVESTRPHLMISDKIVRFHLHASIDPRFGALCLNAGYSSAVLESLKSGMAESQMNISQEKFKTTPLPIPPLAEQLRIVAKVDELMRWCDALETRFTIAQTTAIALLDATLHQILIRNAASPEMPVRRENIGVEDYFAQLIPALLRAAGSSLTLERLNAAVALLFLPKILTPLVSSLNDAAEAHFKVFNQSINEGSFRSMLRMLTQNRIVAFNPDDPAVTLRLNESEAPPIAHIISKDAQYLVEVLNLVPPQTTRETASQLCPPSLKKELLAIA